MRKSACLLCGLEDHDVQMGLVSWSNPIDRQKYAAMPRCKDRAACRARVEANGDRWEVEDPKFSTADLIRGFLR